MSDKKVVRFRRPEAADYLDKEHLVRCSSSTLAKLATLGGGPEFEKVGRTAVYRQDAFDKWAESKKRGPFKSTSEAKASATAVAA